MTTSISLNRTRPLVFPEDIEINPEEINDGTKEQPWYRIVIGHPDSYALDNTVYENLLKRCKGIKVLDTVEIRNEDYRLEMDDVLVSSVIKREYGIFIELETDLGVYCRNWRIDA